MSQGLSDDVINKIIGDELEGKVRNVINHVEKNQNLISQELKKIIPPEVVQLVNEMVILAKPYVGEIDQTLFYCLVTHLNASIVRIKSRKPIINPQLQNIKKN